MSKRAKTVLWIIVIVIVVALLWWWADASNSNNNTSSGNAAAMATTSTYAASDTSDASINADVSNIDGQMNQFPSDSASINKGMNDQPVPQQSM